jgi:hypothetical protein
MLLPRGIDQPALCDRKQPRQHGRRTRLEAV